MTSEPDPSGRSSRTLPPRARPRPEALGLAAIGSALVALVAAGCGGGSAERSVLPLHEDFADCGGFTMNDEVATVDCPGGELRVLVSKPQVSASHFVPFRFDEKQRTLVVSARARAPVPGGVWGIGCLGSGRGEPGRGYVFLVSPAGEAAVLRVDAAPGSGAGGRVAEEFAVLGQRKHFVTRASARHMLHVQCVKAAGGSVRVDASVDGGQPLAAEDDEGIAPFTAATSLVIAERPGTDVRFDDVGVEGKREPVRGPATGDQKAKIALVSAAARKASSPYVRVISVHCEKDHGTCVVTLSGPACQWWYVENVDGVDVAKPKGPATSGLHGTYDDEEPNAVGCEY